VSAAPGLRFARVPKPLVRLASLAFGLLAIAFPLAPQQTAEAPARLEASARAILEKSCLSCHAEAQMSGLDLRDRERMLRGGKRGAALVPGDPGRSLLYQAAAHSGDLKMPPGKIQLASEDLEALRNWIAAGAPWSAAAGPQDPGWWSFRPPRQASPPRLPGAVWVKSPIDAFIAAKLDQTKLKHAPAADRATLIRRVYFDLIGLPPTPERVEQFLRDSSPGAYPALIEELLGSPQYGERWARHWLDVARYADSGGFETDIFYPHAWRYRDYVIKSFNEDKPYDRFLQEQIAGDEFWPDNLDLQGTYQIHRSKLAHLEARIGTGIYTLGPELHESNMNIPKLVHEQLVDAVDTTGSVFLGLTLGCARCHDHKFDPVSQRDYYRFQAIFAPSTPVDFHVVPRHYLADYRQHYTKMYVVGEARTAYRLFEDRIRQRAIQAKRAAFPAEVVKAFEIPEDQRTPQQEMLAAPLVKAVKAIKLDEHFTPAEQTERLRLLEQIGKAVLGVPEKDASQNIPYDGVMEVPAASVLGHHAPALIPETRLLGRGELALPLEKVSPGLPAVLAGASGSLEDFSAAPPVEQRKKLALWLTRPDHPLTARVIVNRVWQWHFGRGLVSTSNDFGRQGQLPSHPELLDWLAVEFVARGWSFKELHRLILLSAAYQQASNFSHPDNQRIDPENRYLWRMNRRRLEGEALWDAMHAVSGALNPRLGGRPVALPLAEDELTAVGSPAQWPVAADPREHTRRGIYILSRRNFTYPMLQAFDNPDSAVSCPEREVTTVAPQALWFLNHRIAFRQSLELAARLVQERGDDPAAWVGRAFELTLSRAPSSQEKRAAIELLGSLTATSAQSKLPEDLPPALAAMTPSRAAALAKFCLTLFNLNEFAYVD